MKQIWTGALFAIALAFVLVAVRIQMAEQLERIWQLVNGDSMLQIVLLAAAIGAIAAVVHVVRNPNRN